MVTKQMRTIHFLLFPLKICLLAHSWVWGKSIRDIALGTLTVWDSIHVASFAIFIISSLGYCCLSAFISESSDNHGTSFSNISHFHYRGKRGDSDFLIVFDGNKTHSERWYKMMSEAPSFIKQGLLYPRLTSNSWSSWQLLGLQERATMPGL